MKGSATRQSAIARARPQAAAALSTLEHLIAQRFDLRCDPLFDDLVRLALQDYRLRYPSCPATAPWLFYDGKPTKHIRGTPDRVDVYCLFCRVLLVHPARWEHDYTEHLRPHTTPCALRSLAGLMTPGAPHTYRLPSSLDGDTGVTP